MAIVGAVPIAAGAQPPEPADTEPTNEPVASDSTTTNPTTTTTTTAPKPTTTTTTTTATTTTATTTAGPTTAGPVDAGADDAPSTTTAAPPPDATTPTTAPAPSVPPATAAPGPVAPPARNITVYPEQMGHILATIRYQESRGLYGIGPNRGNASGAYQFIASTWRNYGGYPHAYLAPPHIQDERAAKDVQMFLDRYDQDVSMVPVMWYYPKAASHPELMDIVPVPQAGNVLTVREYQSRWLATFASISGQPVAPRVSPSDLSAFAGLAPEIPEAHEGVPALSFPVLGPSRIAVPECDDAEAIEVADNDTVPGDIVPGDAGDAADDGPSRADVEAAGLCTDQAPGIVFGVKLQPVLAVADGMVTDVRDSPGSGKPITVTVTDPSGMSYVYAGFNDDNPGTDDGDAPDHLRLGALAEIGTVVRAGQLIGFMGDTDPLPVGVRADVPTDATVEIDPDAIAPHIRITMVDIDGRPVDAFGPVVDALFRQSCRVMIGPWSSAPNGADHDETIIETTDEDSNVDSQWVVTSSGEVRASGWAALVNAGEGCAHTPEATFGPGASGAPGGPLRWFNAVELPTDVWVTLALRDDADGAPGFVRR